MRVRALMIGAVLVGLIVGWVLAPSLLPGLGAPQTLARSITGGMPARPLAVATIGPPPPALPEPELTPEQEADLVAGVLDRTVPATASGRLVVVPGEVAAPDPGAAQVLSVRVEVEQGLAVDFGVFAEHVMTVLNDPRGWGADGVSFARTGGDPDIRVVLASPTLVDTMCAPLRTVSVYSCGRDGHAVLNAQRWAVGAEPFLTAGGDVATYREYLVNHEVGHLLGHPHQQCPAAGALAPVMVQQSMSLGGCLPNAWPSP